MSCCWLLPSTSHCSLPVSFTGKASRGDNCMLVSNFNENTAFCSMNEKILRAVETVRRSQRLVHTAPGNGDQGPTDSRASALSGWPGGTAMCSAYSRTSCSKPKHPRLGPSQKCISLASGRPPRIVSFVLQRLGGRQQPKFTGMAQSSRWHSNFILELKSWSHSFLMERCFLKKKTKFFNIL